MQEHVDRCDTILSGFLTTVHSHSGADSLVVNDVKAVVLALNALNEECDYAIIETDQREEICALIEEAIKKAGLTPKNDITEEWREW